MNCNYDKEERFDSDTLRALGEHYEAILKLLGEDPAREGLLKTPERVAKAMSKIARVVEAYARRLQVQERLTVQIRDCIQKALNPLGVAVVIEASHMCMQMRGVEKQSSSTTTSAFTGAFLTQMQTREEFIHLIKS